MLREEILDQIRETRRLGNFTLGALALFYVAADKRRGGGGRAIYWLAPPMVLLAAVRSWCRCRASPKSPPICAKSDRRLRAHDRTCGDCAADHTRPKFRLSDLWRADIRTYNGNPPGWEQHIEAYGSRLEDAALFSTGCCCFLFTVVAAIVLPDIGAIRP